MKERLAKRIRTISPSQTLAISAKAKAMKAAGENVINFGVGEPDFPTPENIVEAGVAALKAGKTKYTPSAGLAELRSAVCEKFARDNGLFYEPSQIVVSTAHGGQRLLSIRPSGRRLRLQRALRGHKTRDTAVKAVVRDVPGQIKCIGEPDGFAGKLR